MRMIRFQQLKIPVVLLLVGCGSESGTGETGTNGGHYEPPEDVPESLLMESVFGVPERAWDLTISEAGVVYCSAQSGGKLYSWDPIAADRDEETDDLGGLRGLYAQGEDLFLTISDFGVTGSLAVRDGRTAEVLYTQADDGTLFRDPVDLVAAPDGGWVLADYSAPGLFYVAADGVVEWMDAGTSAPNGVEFEGQWLWIAGEDGIWRKDWPDGSPVLIDERPANAVVQVGDAIWAAGAADDIFVVGGPTLGGDNLARPGSMAVAADGSVYVADRVGEDVWRAWPE